MKIYKQQNVWDAALERIRWIYSEFPNVVVSFSGGKDSTVVLNLALMVAKELGRLPQKVMFVDQEAEWRTVIEYVREVMANPNVEPMWFQMPLRIFNSTSTVEPWLQCWEPGAEWMRKKEPISITENRYGTDRFHGLFEAILGVEYPDTKTCYLAGVRAEESPVRFLAISTHHTYKGVAYGKILNKQRQHFTFYPIYDWSFRDVWKAIHEHRWPYCKLYDYMYQYGLDIHKMRVSNVHHETAIHSLFFLQEIEADTWSRLTRRISGINTAGQLQRKNFYVPSELPYMFRTWREYRDYLLENLIADQDTRTKFAKQFKRMDDRYIGIGNSHEMYKAQINTILTNDYHFTKLQNFERRPQLNSWRRHQMGFRNPKNKGNKYIG